MGREQEGVHQAQTLARRVIQHRRRKIGLLQRPVSQCWEDARVRLALRAAAEALAACGRAEWDELEQDMELTPEDTGLAEALDRLFYAVNRWTSTTANTPAAEEKAAAERKPPAVELTTAQAAYAAAEADYLRWRLDTNPDIAKVRRWLPDAITEEELVGLLLNPTAQVLSFEEYHATGQSPLACGRLVRERLALGLVRPDFDEFGWVETGQHTRTSHGAPVAYDVTVEVLRSSGDWLPATVRRKGERWGWTYQTDSVYLRYSRLKGADPCRMEQVICSLPEDPECAGYFVHSCVEVSYYRASIINHLIKACRIIIEDGLALNESAALRYLLMRRQEMCLPFQVQEIGPLFSHEETACGYYQMLIPPWALPQQVEECWRQHRPPIARKRRLPPLTSVEVFRYVLAHTPPGETPTWSKLAAQWERERSEKLSRDKMYHIFRAVQSALSPAWS